MTIRTTGRRIAELEAKIESIRQRAERKKVRAKLEVKLLGMAVRSLDKALNATDDAVLRKALDHARVTVASCLAMTGVKAKDARNVLGSRPRGGGGAKLDGDAILAYLKNNPGQRSEAISAAFSTDADTLRAALKKLIAAGQARTEGQKRATTYFARR